MDVLIWFRHAGRDNVSNIDMKSASTTEDPPSATACGSIEHSISLLSFLFCRRDRRVGPLCVLGQDGNGKQGRIGGDVPLVLLMTADVVVFQADETDRQDDEKHDRQDDCETCIS